MEGTGEHGALDNSDIVFGIWDKMAGIFSPSSSGANALQDDVRTIQAAGDDVVINTASENGLVVAKNHLDPAINPSGTRPNSTKDVIFLSGIFLSAPFRSRGEEKTPTEK